MKVFGVNCESVSEWDLEAAAYDIKLEGAYHKHRLEVIDALIPKELFNKNVNVLDFGCGNGVHLQRFLSYQANALGIDPSVKMVEIAKSILIKKGEDPSRVEVGDAASLTRFATNSMDAIISFNVLAYLTNDEEEIFYRQASRVLRPGGYLIVTHSNELFDLFSLNSYTARFHKKYFLSDKQFEGQLNTLLANCNDESVITYNIRENPLSYKYKLAQYGLEEVRQEFIKLHPAPPALLKTMTNFPTTLDCSEEDRWKLMFMCSTFGSCSIKL